MRLILFKSIQVGTYTDTNNDFEKYLKQFIDTIKKFKIFYKLLYYLKN